jgi:hypothetical protein
VQKLLPECTIDPQHRELEHRYLQDLLVGETGFEPATARPPAGAIRLPGVAFGDVERL